MFRSNSDCEVILHAYNDQGLNIINRLNGMVGISIWDGRKASCISAVIALESNLSIMPGHGNIFFLLLKSCCPWMKIL
ncbi:hypothetical protein LLG96_11710 [bacterium]|nr:hypothetical protein [bacterium]